MPKETHTVSIHYWISHKNLHITSAVGLYIFIIDVISRSNVKLGQGWSQDEGFVRSEMCPSLVLWLISLYYLPMFKITELLVSPLPTLTHMYLPLSFMPTLSRIRRYHPGSTDDQKYINGILLSLLKSFILLTLVDHGR